jgi:hypothetical protein
MQMMNYFEEDSSDSSDSMETIKKKDEEEYKMEIPKL